MENYIIIAVVVVAATFGVISTVKHFAGKGCCGGGGYRPYKNKLPKVLYKKTFKVGGMHCAHCKNRVEEVVNDIKGVSGRVDLKKGELTVSYAQNVDDDIILSKIKKVGYTTQY